MPHIVRRLSVVVVVALCVVVFALAKAQQQTRSGAQAAKDTCWGKTPCPEDHRPPVAFREDWMDGTPGVPTDYKDKDLDAHLQNKNLGFFADCAAKKWPFGQSVPRAVCEKAAFSVQPPSRACGAMN